MTHTLLKTTSFGLAVLVPTEAALRAAELFHVDVTARPPAAAAAILPRPVWHLHSTGNSELPAYVHTGEAVTMVNSTAASQGLPAAALPAHLSYRAEGGRITFRFA